MASARRFVFFCASDMHPLRTVVVPTARTAPSAVLSVRVSASECALLEAAAEQASTSLSDLVRRRALDATESGLLNRCIVTMLAGTGPGLKPGPARRRRKYRRFKNCPRLAPSGRSESGRNGLLHVAASPGGRLRHGGVRLRARRVEPWVPPPRPAQPGTGGPKDDHDLKCGSWRQRWPCGPVDGAGRASLVGKGAPTPSTQSAARRPVGSIGERLAVAGARRCGSRMWFAVALGSLTEPVSPSALASAWRGEPL